MIHTTTCRPADMVACFDGGDHCRQQPTSSMIQGKARFNCKTGIPKEEPEGRPGRPGKGKRARGGPPSGCQNEAPPSVYHVSLLGCHVMKTPRAGIPNDPETLLQNICVYTVHSIIAAHLFIQRLKQKRHIKYQHSQTITYQPNNNLAAKQSTCCTYYRLQLSTTACRT